MMTSQILKFVVFTIPQKSRYLENETYFICYIHIVKSPWISDNSSIQNIHEQDYMDSEMLSYSCPLSGNTG